MAVDFPRRWEGPNWKQQRVAVETRRKPKKGPTAKRRAAKHNRLAAQERVHKAAVRRRDGPHSPTVGRCRFPLCGCHGMAVFEGSPAFVEVSHYTHKGMGGDPTGELSQTSLMICLCAWRHKSGRFAVDKKNLRWIPLTDVGADGPVIWELNLGEGWVELARESTVQILEPIAPNRIYILNDLARMTN